MILKYSRLGYFIGEGFSNVFKNKKSTGASLMIMCATMIIFGIFLILGENINHFVKEIESIQGIQVFVKKEATQEQMDELADKIRKIDGVSTIEYVSKEEALSQMKEKYDIKVKRVGMNIDDIMNKLLSEKQAKSKDGVMDVVWINGENFKTAKENNLLLGSFTEKLPNFNDYIDL